MKNSDFVPNGRPVNRGLLEAENNDKTSRHQKELSQLSGKWADMPITESFEEFCAQHGIETCKE